MGQITTDPVDRFVKELERQQASELTIRNYRSDLSSFARWFDGSTGEPFSPSRVTPTGVDLGTVPTLLGHERLETAATYARPGAWDLERAVVSLEQAAPGG